MFGGCWNQTSGLFGQEPTLLSTCHHLCPSETALTFYGQKVFDEWAVTKHGSILFSIVLASISSSQTCIPMTSSATIEAEPEETVATLQQTLLASAIADDMGPIQQTEFTSSAMEESIAICDDRNSEENNDGQCLPLGCSSPCSFRKILEYYEKVRLQCWHSS